MLFKRTIAATTLFGCLLFVAISFLSCVDKIRTNLMAYKMLDEGLTRSNALLANATQVALRSIRERVDDPATSERGKKWYAKAEQVVAFSKDITGYIENIRSELKKEAGLKEGKENESFRESDKNAVVRLFDKQGKADELYDQLKTYKKNVFSVDSQIAIVFDTVTILTTPSFDLSGNKREFFKTFFDDLPTVAALAILSKFQNNITIIENRLIDFCSYKIPYSEANFDTYFGFASTTSNYVKANDEVEIIAALGAFSKAAMPEITIADKIVPLSSDGTAHYKFKASAKPGKHLTKVRFDYTDQQGNKQIALKDVEYTVVQ